MRTLEELIPSYALNKQELDSYKKLVDKENAEIKELMASLNLDEKEVGDYIAKRTISNRDSLDEEGLISLFTSVPSFCQLSDEFGIIKMKPYLDYDALENAMYNDAFKPEQVSELSKYKESKEVISLRVTKIKKKKGE